MSVVRVPLFLVRGSSAKSKNSELSTKNDGLRKAEQTSKGNGLRTRDDGQSPRRGFADQRRASGHSYARGLQSGNLVYCGALATGDDSAGMTHAAAGRSRPAANETHHRLSYPCLDEL